MKKIIPRLLALMVCTIVPALIFAQTSNLITQLKVMDSDTTFRYLYYYDSNSSNKMLETKYYLKDNLWFKKSQTEWLYNNNKLETQRERVFVANDWVNTFEINYTYEDESLISESHLKYINGMTEQIKLLAYTYENGKLKSRREFFNTDGQLVLKLITENTYNNDTLIYSTIKKISSIQSEMMDYKLTNSYYANGKLKSQLMEVKQFNGNWENSELMNWYYEPSNKLSSMRTKKWNKLVNKWENSTMISYDYINNQIDNEIYYKWSSMFWQKTTKYSYRYNSNGSLLSTDLMLPVFRQWRSVSTINYSDFLNEKANKMETVLSFWGGNAGDKKSADIPFKFNNEMEIKKGNQITISYEKIDNTDISTFSLSNDISIRVFPNPSEDYFYFNPEDYNISSWTVTDLKGQIVVENRKDIRSGVIDLSNAAKGVYLLKVITPERILTQKLIKK